MHPHRRLLTCLAAVGLAGSGLLATGAPAHAAFPGSNGRIAFELEGAIYTVDASGDDRRQLTTGTTSHAPSYSPDGRTIVFQRGGDL